MSDDINFKNNPLHGVSLKNLLIEMVDHYSFEILFAYLNINCFKTNPSIESSVKFLKKTDWAREKVESFYMYEYKNLPKPSSTQFSISPRDRIVPEHHQVGEPAELSLEDAERLREKRAKKAAEFNKGSFGKRGNSNKSYTPRSHSETPRPKPAKTDASTSSNPWGNWEK
jgi:uncharacterized protein (DUF2132 family)